MTRILIVDDDPFIHDYLHRILTPEYTELLDAESIEEGWHMFQGQQPDLVLLDLNLPDGSGLDLCRCIRARDSLIPVLILTARHQLTDRVDGLSIGADDYILKPFERKELLARIQTALRRQQAFRSQQRLAPQIPEQLEIAGLSIASAGWEASYLGQPLRLSKTEFRLLRLFVQHADSALGRDFLLQQVWGFESAGSTTRTVDNFVMRLRKKLDAVVTAAGRDLPVLETIYGVGYTLRTV